MKIGIITYWKSSDNYGQILQCYALQKYLRERGYDAYLIKYAPTYKENRPLFVKTLQKLQRISLNKIVDLITGKRAKDKALAEENARKNIKRKFDEFRLFYLHSTDIVYHSIEELRKNPPKADLYITGSDQVWNNPLTRPDTAGWYLDFGNETTKRISYAASIGRELLACELKQFKKYIRAFSAISVREYESKCICEQLGMKNVQQTVDPTLLLPIEDYYKLAANISSAVSYMFIYILNITSKEEIFWNNINQYLNKRCLKPKIVCSSGYIQAHELISDHPNELITIPEWLAYIRNAQCVVTTSFHGIVFSIKMHKPFLAILLTNKYAKGNSRITSLLHSLGLEYRIFNPSASFEKQMDKEIDWEKVEHNILQLQQVSYDFLNNNLS